MSQLFEHLAEISETSNGGFEMTQAGQQFFSRFLWLHGKLLQQFATFSELVDALRECNEADFVLTRYRLLGRAPLHPDGSALRRG